MTSRLKQLASIQFPASSPAGKEQPSLAQIVGLVTERFGLRAGMAGDDATDLLLVLTSSGTYLTLQRYGWSEEKYMRWLTDTLARQLLAQPGRRGTER